MKQALIKQILCRIEQRELFSRRNLREIVSRLSVFIYRSSAYYIHSSALSSLLWQKDEKPLKVNKPTQFGSSNISNNPALYEKGFTLIELMVVIVLMAVILSFGVPSFIGVINNNRITTAINELSTTLAIARTEAVKVNSVAIVKPSSGDWAGGYQVRMDMNDNGNLDDDEDVIRIVGSIPDQLSYVDSTTTIITFSGLGTLMNSTGECFAIDSPTGKAFGRKLTVNSIGSTSIDVQSDINTNPVCP